MKKVLVFSVVILALIAGFFPMLVSTSLGKPLFLQLLKNRLQANNLSIEKMELSWFGPQVFEQIHLTRSDLDATIERFSSDIPFWNFSRMGDSFGLENGNFRFPTYENAQLTNVNAKILESKILASGSTPQGGSLEIQGTIESRKDLDITMNLKQIPTIALDQLLKAQSVFYKAVGPTLDLKGAITLSDEEGSVSVDMSAPNAQASLDGSIANGALTLNQPFLATLKVTPELSQVITQKISHKVITQFNAKDPFVLRIYPEGFSCPIRSLRLDQILIGKASLDLGQVNVQSGESLHFLVKLFKNKDFSKNIDIWFSNVFFSTQEGVIQLGRLDALLSRSIHICTWGDINLNNEHLHMFLGLPADTLEQSFDIKTISRNYVLKIPVRGTIHDPQFDTGPAIAKIATMAASQQIPTVGGKVFGGLVNVFTQTQDDGEAPPPNRPFPWER